MDQLVDGRYRQRVATALRQTRLAAEVSLRELARRVGTSHATLIAYERAAKVPSVVTFLRIMEGCNVAVDFSTTKRIRASDGIARGDELLAVLRLAQQFPARMPRTMDYPVFPRA